MKLLKDRELVIGKRYNIINDGRVTGTFIKIGFDSTDPDTEAVFFNDIEGPLKHLFAYEDDGETIGIALDEEQDWIEVVSEDK